MCVCVYVRVEAVTAKWRCVSITLQKPLASWQALQLCLKTAKGRWDERMEALPDGVKLAIVTLKVCMCVSFPVFYECVLQCGV